MNQLVFVPVVYTKAYFAAVLLLEGVAGKARFLRVHGHDVIGHGGYRIVRYINPVLVGHEPAVQNRGIIDCAETPANQFLHSSITPILRSKGKGFQYLLGHMM